MSKKTSADAIKAVAEEHERIAEQAKRKGRNLGHFHQLQALKAFLGSSSFECKTIGNGNPAPYHCFACTWSHLHKEVSEAVEFWEDSAYRNGALS